MTDLVDSARDRIGRAIFESWDARDVDELMRLMRKLADVQVCRCAEGGSVRVIMTAAS